MSASKLHAIDTLRGLAAVQVIAFHLATMPNTRLATDPWSRPFIEHGNSGVTLFFLISAFTLALSMKTRTGEKRPLCRLGCEGYSELSRCSSFGSLGC